MASRMSFSMQFFGTPSYSPECPFKNLYSVAQLGYHYHCTSLSRGVQSKTRMHSSRMRTAPLFTVRGVSLTDSPGQRPPSGQRQRPPLDSDSPLDRDPHLLDRDPLDRDPPALDRDPRTETLVCGR